MLATSTTQHGARAAYAVGVDTFYTQHGAQYRNPHEPVIHALLQDALSSLQQQQQQQQQHQSIRKVLDLCAGSGEVSRCVLESWEKEHSLRRIKQKHNKNTNNDDDNDDDKTARCLDAIDPYTYEAYEAAMGGRPCQRLSFVDIAATGLSRHDYDVVICSFALHLAPPSVLYAVCVQLALSARYLIILTPHKRPVVEEYMGWTLQHEMVQDKVRRRVYVNNGLFAQDKE